MDVTLITEIRTLSAEFRNRDSFRITYALMPFRGSDREVGWTALEADRTANRNVTYITAPVDYRAISHYFPDSIREGNKRFLDFGTVRVIVWPFDLPNRFFRIGYLRFLIWVILLQLFIAARAGRAEGKKVHFLTYTQLATPIILPRQIAVFHGPVGVIPRIPRTAPVSASLFYKSQVMWRLIMPTINFLKRNRVVRTAVVHPSLLPELGKFSH